MKRIISMLILITMIFSLVGCRRSVPQKTEPVVPKREKTKKVLRVGMNVGYKPFEYYEEDGTTISGFDYELAKAICEKLGYELEIKEMEWDYIFKGLDEKEYDMIISAVTINDERKAKYDFSTPYVQNYQSIVTLNQAPRKATEMFMLKGLKVGFLKSSTSETYLKNYMKTNNIACGAFGYDTMASAFRHLKDGKIEAIVCDSMLAEQYCTDAMFEMTWQDKTIPEEFAICLPKGSSFLQDINNALGELKSEGKLKELTIAYLK